jgi:hypothetical protein
LAFVAVLRTGAVDGGLHAGIDEGLSDGAFAAVFLVLHVQIALSRQEQATHDLAQSGEVRRDVDTGHEQVIALLGLIDVDVHGQKR